MPIARIDLAHGKSSEFCRTVGDIVYTAMVEVAKVPADDRFQVITSHPREEIVYPENGYLGVRYSDDIVLIQITWLQGRTIEVKKAFYRRVANDLHKTLDVRKEDVVINLIDSQARRLVVRQRRDAVRAEGRAGEPVARSPST